MKWNILLVAAIISFVVFVAISTSDKQDEINLLATCLAQLPEPLTEIPEPNEPRKIIMPSKYKCPVHGVIDVFFTLDIDGKKYIYCKNCAMVFVRDLLDLNLKKLEKVQ